MPLLNFTLEIDGDKGARIEETIGRLLRGSVDIKDGFGFRFQSPLGIVLRSQGDHIEWHWHPNPEAEIPRVPEFFEPELLLARSWPTETHVYARAGRLIIKHSRVT